MDVVLTSIPGNAVTENVETATPTIEQGNGYTVGDPESADIAIPISEFIPEPVFLNSFESGLE